MVFVLLLLDFRVVMVRSCAVRRGSARLFVGLFACVERGRVEEVRKTMYNEERQSVMVG